MMPVGAPDRGRKTNLDPERTAELVYALIDPGLYHLLVVEQGWDHRAFTAWLATTLERQLIGN